MKTILSSLALSLAITGAATAAEIEVKMLNKGADGERMVFEPAVITADIGDTIRFVPTDKGHNSATVKGGLPEGAERANGKINRELVYEITESGIHVFKCTPHLGMGMIAVVIADNDMANESAVSSLRMPKKSKQRLNEYLEQARKATNS